MPNEYQIVTGSEVHVNERLRSLGTSGWKPILMSSAAVGSIVNISVMMEHATAAAAGNRVQPNPLPGFDPTTPRG
jgi:hypothetical protein